jgi:pimeloyl-ACP methyl ester carboxylesterase
LGCEPRVLTVAAGGTEVVVREWGDETGRPLLFWPGLNPFGSLQLNEAGPAWAERGFRVSALAAPGMGESPALRDPDGYRHDLLSHAPDETIALVADFLERNP